MAEGIFVGLSEEKLLEIRDAAIAANLQGGWRSGFSLGEASGQIDTSRCSPILILREANFALRRLDPTRYGGPNVTRVRATFNLPEGHGQV